MICDNCKTVCKINDKFCHSCGCELKPKAIDFANDYAKKSKTFSIISVSLSGSFLFLFIVSIISGLEALMILTTILAAPCLITSIVLGILGISFYAKAKKGGADTSGSLGTAIVGLVLSTISIVLVVLMFILTMYLIAVIIITIIGIAGGA